MRVLALDLANTVGWALKDYDLDTIVSGVWRLNKGINKDKRPFRLLRLYKHLQSCIPISTLAYEQPGRLQGHASKIIPAYQGVVELWCVTNGVEIWTCSATHIKSLATGSGKASKDDMVEAAMREWPGVEFATNDEADARWILKAFESQTLN